LFDATTIHRMLDQYRRLLEGVVADPSLRIAALPLLAPAERRQLLVDWNATAPPYLHEATLNRMFLDQAARTPDRVALIEGDQNVTYRMLQRRASQLAQELRSL